MENIKFFLANSPEALAEKLRVFRATATVEAEYGDAVVAGSVLTMAHHGPRAGQKAPCAYDNVATTQGIEAVGLSHFDLDTLGGCMAILGCKPEAPTFWALAEYVDLNGPHKLADGVKCTGATGADVDCLYAFWAWSQAHRCTAPRDGSVADVTAQILAGAGALREILGGDPALLTAGRTLAAKEAALNIASLVLMHSTGQWRVILREAGEFTNHLYATPEGVACDAVVAFNSATGVVTLSFAEPPTDPTKTACALVQAEWGPLAGGHAGIAGSPRGQQLDRAAAERLLARVVAAFE